MKQLKMPWNDFVEAAMQTIKADYPDANNPVRMATQAYERDFECYETPSYVLIDLEKKA
jgi:hypothetical protein